MKSKKSSETIKPSEWKKTNRSSGWIKTTAFAIMWLFTACENIPNDSIIINADEKSEKFNIEYQIGSPESGSIIDYNIFVRKNGEIFEWNIKQSDWLISNNTKIETDNVDRLFHEISKKLDHDFITDNTKNNKDKKVNFAKKAYKDNILNKSKKWGKYGEIKIKYKK